MRTLLLAKWIAPMDQPLIRDGGVLFEDGRILDVGNGRALRARFPDAQSENTGDSVVLPGLVNAHTHLELTNVSRPEPKPNSFVDWLLHLIHMFSTLHDGELRALIQRGVRDGVTESVRFGVTTVGDITRHAAISRPVLARSALRAVSFGEVVGMAARRASLPNLIDAARDRTQQSERLTIGLEPHAPYSLDLAGYAECVEVARRDALPITTHLAETPHETEFLSDHQGEFRRLWETLGGWTEGVPRLDGGPIRAMQSVGLLDLPAILAHVNYCDDDELEVLANGRASVVYCPRTHAWFGPPPHRWRDMLARGINVAVGTDSRASSPDLNIVEDLRLLHRIAPDCPATALWELATIRGARALGQYQRVGSLSPTKDADAVVFPARTDDPLTEILEAAVLPSQVWVAGQRRV